MIRVKASRETINKLRAIADYQFRPGVGEILFKEDSYLVISKNTGRIRAVEDNEGLVATIRASDHRIIPTCIGGERIRRSFRPPVLRVVVLNEFSREIGEGGNVFSKHIIDIDEELLPWDEVIVVDEDDRLLAVGRLVLAPIEALYYIRGVAVLTREGCWKSIEKVET